MHQLLRLKVALLTMFAAAGLLAADTIEVKLKPRGGQEVLIRSFAEFDRNCQLVRAQVLTVVDAPANGRFDTRPGEVTIGANWVGTGTCVGTKLNGIHAYYIPNAGYTGSDRLSFDIGYVRHRTVRAHVQIDVAQ